MRILLFTGKGGSGKTTTAAATALQIAATGKKTLVLSTDPAHSLSDALDIPLGPEPVFVAPNLDAQELDIYYSMKKYWGSLRKLMLEVFRWQGTDRIIAEELSALPGMEEGSAFLWIEQYVREAAYEVIVIDSAPTGETLTLLSLPQVTKWWTNRFLPIPKFAMKGMSAMMGATTGVPFFEGLEELDLLLGRMESVHRLLSDPEVASIRILVNPEKMVIAEARRAYTHLQLHGYHVDAVILNRELPEDATGFMAGYLKTQKRYVKEIEADFAPLPILRVPHFGEEVYGVSMLTRLGDALYGKRVPDALLHEGTPFHLEETREGYTLNLKIPAAADAEIKVRQNGNVLLLEMAGRRRPMFLPQFLNFYEIRETRLNPPELQVHFARR